MVRPVKKAAKGKAKKPSAAKLQQRASAPTAAVPKVWRPGVDPVEEEEELQYDPSAYDCLHALSLDWPCLSFDIVRDQLGGPRTAFPHCVTLLAGTQAAPGSQNSLFVVKLDNMGQGRHGKNAPKQEEDEDEDDDDMDMSDEEEEEEGEGGPPKMAFRAVQHSGGINRVRVMGQSPGVVAVWGDSGQVKVFDVSTQLKEVAEEQEPKKHSLCRIQLKHVQAHTHSAEGYALDWSPVKLGQLASGDCRGRIHVWQPQSSSSWQVSGAYKGHEKSVEDLQWSPTEETVFASCSADGTIRVWDTRERERPMISVTASEADINVISWNRSVTYMMASGADDGVLKIWDLRSFSDGTCVSQFNYHHKAITSVEWAPHEGSMLLTTSADNQLGVWDLALERDPEEEVALADISNAEAQEEIPAQLLFSHMGQKDLKEAHWHPQIPGLMLSTALDGFNVFKPGNI